MHNGVIRTLAAACSAMSGLAAFGASTPVGTEFSYQGRLDDGSGPVTDTCDFIFGLWTDASSTDPADLLGELTFDGVNAIDVEDGVFTVVLDFGDAFDGNKRWLEIQVRCPSGTGSYVTITPRQELRPTPYALMALDLKLPYDGLSDVPNCAFDVTNTGPFGLAICGTVESPLGSYAGRFETRSELPDIAGVFGLASAQAGQTAGGFFRNDSESGKGVYGWAAASTGLNYGGYFKSDSSNGFGVYGAGRNRGVWGECTGGLDCPGVYGEARSYGVEGYATEGNGWGVYGHSAGAAGTGVYGSAPSFGIEGHASGSLGTGVYGESGYNGVYGYATGTSPISTGVWGAAATDGRGVFGWGPRGVQGESPAGDTGILGFSGIGVWGYTDAENGTGVIGDATSDTGETIGVHGTSESPSGIGVYGNASATDGNNIGVSGFTSGADGYAVYGNTSYASVYQWAGYFDDRLYCWALFSTFKSFRIDHPLDPENKFLTHSCVESSERLNVYSGNVVTNANAEAWVELPDWFDSLNRDFRYQLTVVGEFAQAIIASKLQGNRFQIRTDKPGVEVSWQVTGTRCDPAALAYPLQVEESKPAHLRGKYLNPAAYGQPEEKSVSWSAQRRVRGLAERVDSLASEAREMHDEEAP